MTFLASMRLGSGEGYLWVVCCWYLLALRSSAEESDAAGSDGFAACGEEAGA